MRSKSSEIVKHITSEQQYPKSRPDNTSEVVHHSSSTVTPSHAETSASVAQLALMFQLFLPVERNRGISASCSAEAIVNRASPLGT